MNEILNEMDQLIKDLFPICRSLTGDGNRKSLSIIKNYIPIETHEVPSGTKVFDWIVPEEWNVNDAYIINPDGEKILEFKKSNIHLMGYSEPIDKVVSLEELKKHLYTIESQPDAIPYRTSYYERKWGFCISFNDYKKLKKGNYHVFIDSTLKKGSLTYGEININCKSNEDVFLLSTYICHPSLGNDNLSGIVLATFVAKLILEQNYNMSFRIIFVPETLGALIWLNANKNKLHNIKSGLVATCLGDKGFFTYKMSKTEKSYINRVVLKTLKDMDLQFKLEKFYPFGSDERQYNSLGFNLEIGSLMRTPYRQFPEYHTSSDNLDSINKKNIYESLKVYINIINTLTKNKYYINLMPYGEPFLKKYGFYDFAGGSKKPETLDAIKWILCFSDGNMDLLEISELSEIKFEIISNAADLLKSKNIIKEKNLNNICFDDTRI